MLFLSGHISLLERNMLRCTAMYGNGNGLFSFIVVITFVYRSRADLCRGKFRRMRRKIRQEVCGLLRVRKKWVRVCGMRMHLWQRLDLWYLLLERGGVGWGFYVMII